MPPKRELHLNVTELRFFDGRPMFTIEEGCWIWQGAKDKDGYGRVRNGPISELAHRCFYKLKYGRIKRGKELDHTCRRRSCCNPDHMREVTREQNLAELFNEPVFSEEQIALITEAILDDVPLGQIAYDLGVSKWSIVKISKMIVQKEQLSLTINTPF